MREGRSHLSLYFFPPVDRFALEKNGEGVRLVGEKWSWILLGQEPRTLAIPKPLSVAVPAACQVRGGD